MSMDSMPTALAFRGNTTNVAIPVCGLGLSFFLLFSNGSKPVVSRIRTTNVAIPVCGLWFGALGLGVGVEVLNLRVWSLGVMGLGWIVWGLEPRRVFHCLSLLFCTLVTGPRRFLSFKLSDTRVYKPHTRVRLGTTAHI